MNQGAKRALLANAQPESESRQLNLKSQVVALECESRQLKVETRQADVLTANRKVESRSPEEESEAQVVAVVAPFSVGEAASLAQISKQSLQKSITEKHLQAELVVCESGPNKGRPEYRIQAASLFAVYPVAEKCWRARQSAETVAARMVQAEVLRAAEREKLQAENPSTTDRGTAKAWHLNQFLQFLAECGHGKKRALSLYVAAILEGNIEVPEWVKAAHSKLSERSLERWAKALELGGASALDPNYKGSLYSYFDHHPEQGAWLEGLYLQMPHLSVRLLHEAVEAEFPNNAPSLYIVRRWLARYQREHAQELLLATNPDKYKNSCQVAFGSRSEDVVRLNQRWETDATKADILFEGDSKRYTLCQVVDVYSDRRRFLLTETSSGKAHGQILRRCILEWGLPEQIKTDNGKDYTSKFITRLMADLAIEQILCKPFSGEEKPHVERGFGLFLHDLVEMMPGFTGHNVAQAQDIRARKSFAQRIQEAKKGEAVEAGMTREAFEDFMEKWCLAEEHRRRLNGRLQGRTPAEVVDAWAKERPVRRIQDPMALDYILAEGATKHVGKQGIRHQKRLYIAPELGAIPGRTVEIRLSPDSPGRIAVFREGVFYCIAVDPELVGVDRAEVASRARAIQRGVDKATRAVHRELKAQVKPAAVLESIIQHRLRKVDPTSTFQVPEAIETTATAAAVAARAAENLAQEAQRQVEAPRMTRQLPLSAEEERHVRDLLAQEIPEDPRERYIRLRRKGIYTLAEREWMDHFETVPEGLGLKKAFEEFAITPKAQ